VYGLTVNLETNAIIPVPDIAGEESHWFAIQTLSRHEKRVAQQLQENGVPTFLPLMEQIRRWSDRRARVEVPLFSCYAFVRIVQTAKDRLRVLRIPGVLGFVGSERIGTQIPNDEIENLQTAIREKAPFTVHPFLNIGKRMRICGGSLDGVEGILVSQGRDQSLVISVELLRRSVAIRVEGYDIQLV
jgi:transcription antitermination factor NusG